MHTNAVSKKKAPAAKKVMIEVSGENDTVITGPIGAPKPFTSSSKGNALNRVKTGFVSKKPPIKTTVEKLVQTDNPDVALITGDSHPPEYWKLLAETRLKELEESQKRQLELENENEELKGEIKKLKDENDLLQKENETLETMLEGAKEMAEYFEALPESSSDGAESE